MGGFMSWGTDIRQARMLLDMTQEEFAGASGASVQAVRTWESRNSKPASLKIAELEAYLERALTGEQWRRYLGNYGRLVDGSWAQAQ